MKVDPLIVTAALLLAGVTAFAAAVVVEHREARARRPPPPPEVELEPPPRRAATVVPAPRPRPSAPPPPPATVELRVHVAGPFGLVLDGVGVSIHRRGDPDEEWSDLAEVEPSDDGLEAPAGMFEASELDPGHYDVRAQAPGMRTTRLDDLAPGPKVIEVALARAPVLLGALGGPGGCSGAQVDWSAPGLDEDDAETEQAALDAGDCTFVVDEIPEPGPIAVVATRGKTITARALVTLPLTGDPGFVCLEPPCATEPASLLVYVGDLDHRPITDATLTWTLQGNELEGAMGTATGGGPLFVHGRRPGQTLALRAERGEQSIEATTTLGPGVTELLMTLPAEPRGPDDEEASDLGQHPREVVITP